MSPATFDSAEAEWQTQFAAMRAALAELQLPDKTIDSQTDYYGSDIDFDEEEDFSANSGDDVWDFIDGTDEAYSSDGNNYTPEEPTEPTNGYGPQWLKGQCILFASRKHGLSAEDLQEQIMALLVSDSVEAELQSTLTDILGFDDLELVIELIAHREEITAPSPFSPAKEEGLFGKLQTKRQREEALRRRDYEPKHAELGPALNRDGPQYPHVYKAHSAGNNLDHKGQKYGLPVGTERKEHEVNLLSSSLLLMLFYFLDNVRFMMLMFLRNTRSIASLLLKSGLSGQVGSLSRSPRWMASAGVPSKATQL